MAEDERCKCTYARLDGNYFRALCIAAQRGHPDCVAQLLKSGSAQDQRNTLNWSPLMCAVKGGSTQAVELIIQHGHAMDMEFKEHPGYTAFLLAASRGEAEMVKVLMKHGCNLNATDNNNNTALHLAAATNNIQCVSLLLEKGLKLEEKNNQGSTAILIACRYGNLRMIDYLLQCGADAFAVDNMGNTALHINSTYVTDLPTVKRLITLNLNVNSQNIHKRTPLILICKKGRGQEKFVQLLLLANADVRIRDCDGRTAYESLILSTDYELETKVMADVLIAGGGNITYFAYFKTSAQGITKLPVFRPVKMLSLSSICRKQIREHLISPSAGNCNNLFVGVSRLPLPNKLKKYLVFNIELQET